MEVSKSHLLLKRVINIKVVVTPRWKEDMQQQLQSQINQFDSQVQKIEIQGQQAEAEIQKQSLNPADPMVVQQLNNIRVQVNQKKSELLEKKTRFCNSFSKSNFWKWNAKSIMVKLKASSELKLGITYSVNCK